MILIINKYFIPKGYQGMTIFPFVFLKEQRLKENSVVINHEKIHLRQQIELLVLPFFVWYLVDYLIKILLYKNLHTAYRNISFEREAYANEKDLAYLKSRSFWNFLKY